ncbi:MAG: M28 family peptidase [Cytophagaceae bacterium]|nr:M28 family peptidase [Cytophagaceae bacterium]
MKKDSLNSSHLCAFEGITKKILLSIVFFLVPLLIFSQNLSRAKKYVDTLAAPGMHGRGYIEAGDKKAAIYLQDRFMEIGLLPFKNYIQGPDYYFQNFKFDINTFPGKLSLTTDKKTLRPGEDFIVHPSSGAGAGTLSVKYLDTLIFTDKKKAAAFLKTRLGKYALVYHGKDLKKIMQMPVEFRDKIFSAGCLIEINEKKLTASLSGTQNKYPYFQVLQSAFDLKTKKVSFCVDAELKKTYESQNVIGYISGKINPDSFVVISAHYDHLGRMGKEIYFPGANDNASGISMLLELAWHYSRPGNDPEYTLVLMAFGAEEAGLIGSKYYTENPFFPLSKIKFLINLDLLGTGDEGATVVNATKFPEAFALLTRINDKEKYLPVIKSRGPAPNSDHYFFTQKGVPSFFIYTLGGISAYHDIYDKRETLPLTKFSEVFRLLSDFINQL